MKKTITKTKKPTGSIMNWLMSAIILLGLGATNVMAQLTTVLPNDNSTSGNGRAPSVRFSHIRAVYLIKASEMIASGFASGTQVGQIGWTYQAAGTAGSAPLKVYLQNTADVTNTKSTSWATAISTMTLAHNATTTLGATTTPNIVFSGGSNFTYTGGGVYVAYDWGCYSGTLQAIVTMCNSAGLSGNAIISAQQQVACPGTASATLNLTSTFRPETRFGPVQVPNDGAVDLIYTLGSMANTFTTNHIMQAKVSNIGINTLTSLPVTLNITGANTFSNVQTIASLAPGATAIVTFAAFTPSATGSNTVTVSIPNDGANGNNSQTLTQPVTTNLDSYKYSTPISGGVGFNPPLASSAVFVSKFNAIAGSQLNEVKVDFQANTTARTFKIAIYPNNAGLPDITPSFVSTLQSIPANSPQFQAFIPISPTITLPGGDFYVGVVEEVANTVNFGFSYQNEVPVRTGSFYFANCNNTTYVATTAWADFGLNGANFRPAIEAQFFIPTPPNCAISMLPADATTDLCFAGTSQTLSWASGGGAPTGYDVYFGTASNPPLVSPNQVGTTYNATGLAPSTQYFWKVVAKNQYGDAPSCSTFSFTTGSAFTPVSITPGAIGLCAGGSAVATANPAGATSYSWSGGLGSAQTATVTTPGTYTVTVAQGSCVQTATASAAIIPNPTMNSVTATPSAICSGSNATIAASASLPIPPAYCASTHASGCSGDDITHVVLSNINNFTSGCGSTTHYTYFNGGGAQTTTLNGGTNYTLSVSFGTDANQFFGAWIDYNYDGTFSTSEFLGASTNAGANGTANVSFTVPMSAPNGVLRLRIIGGNDAAVLNTDACAASSSPWGETQDYDVTIAGATTPISYVWSPSTFLSGTTSASVTANAATAITTYSVVATAYTGCTATGNTTLTVNPLPTVDAGGAIAAICAGSTTTALGGSFGGGATSAIWSDGGVGGTFANNTGTTPGTATYTAANISPASVTLTLTTSGGSCGTITATKTLTVNPKPVGSASNTSICSGLSTNVVLNGGASYNWVGSLLSGSITGFTVNGSGTPITDGLTNGTNNTAGQVRYTVTPTSSFGCVGNTFLTTVTVNPSPTGSSSSQDVCSGDQTSNTLFTTTSGNSSYTWTVSGSSASVGGYSPCSLNCGTSISQTLTNSGTSDGSVTYTVIPRSSLGCLGSSFTVTDNVGATPVGVSTGDETIFSGGTTNIGLSSVTSSDFSWNSAVISGSATGNGSSLGGFTSITDMLTNTGTGDAVVQYTISVASSTLGCPGTDVIVNVTVNALPTVTCPVTANINTDAGMCTSTASIGTPVTTGVGTSVSVDNSGPYSLGSNTVTWTITDGGGNTSSCSQTFVVNDMEGPSITPPATASLTTDAGMCTSAGSIGTATASDNCGGVITISPDNAGPYSLGANTVTWTATDIYGNSSTATQTVNVTDGEAPSIAAPSDITMCSATSGVTVALGSPSGSDNCGTVTYSNDAPLTFGYGLTVVTWTADDGNGNTSTAAQNVTINQTPIGSAPSVVICNGSPANVTLSSNVAGTSYTWTAAETLPSVIGYADCGGPCGTTIQDVLTNTGNVHGVVQYTVTPMAGTCTGSPFTVDVTVGAVPATPVISGPAVICQVTSAIYTVAAVPEATTYTWTVPTGVTGMTITSGQGTTALHVNISAGTVSGDVTCVASNGCGNSMMATLAVTKKPGTPGSITGATSVCGQATATYSVLPVFNTTNYIWSLPVGLTALSGAGTTQITVNIASTFVGGSLSVAASNACGSVPGPSIYITGHVPNIPGTISGPANVCGVTTATYSIPPVAGASGYVWTITGGGVINGSNTGTSVSVTLPGNAAGSISVAATNVCGTGATRTLALTIAAIQPAAIVGPANVCGMSTASYSVPSVGTGYTYNWVLIAGMSWPGGVVQTTNAITVNIAPPVGTTTATGILKVSSTNACGLTSAQRTTTITRCLDPMAMNNDVESNSTAFSNIYPNPTSSEFTIDVTAEMDKDVIIEVYDVLGNIVVNEKHSIVTGTSVMKTNINEFKAGLYFVRLTEVNGNVVNTQRVVKQ